MSLYGVMRSSASGMSAQASRISGVAENVANSNTTGYKAVRMQFSSLMVDTGSGNYNSGSVETDTQRLISSQGTLTATSSATDLGIQGQGFFVVQGPSGENVLTRDGSFTPNASGELVRLGYERPVIFERLEIREEKRIEWQAINQVEVSWEHAKVLLHQLRAFLQREQDSKWLAAMEEVANTEGKLPDDVPRILGPVLQLRRDA